MPRPARMASIVGGLGCSHAPSIGAVYDRKQTEEAGWKPLFESIAAGDVDRNDFFFETARRHGSGRFVMRAQSKFILFLA